MMRHLAVLLLVSILAACAPAAPATMTVATSATWTQTATPAAATTGAAAPAETLAQALSEPPATPAVAAASPTLAAPSNETTPATEPASQPQGFPDAQAYTWRPVVGGLARPLAVAHAGDGSGRLFVVEQVGRIRIVQDGLLLGESFLDISDRAGSEGSEQGLLGLAFHPDYRENGFFYVNYTDRNGDTVIARFQVSGADANRADPTSERRLLFVPQPYRNHNGGMVVFGPDGYLYLGLGDGGSAGDPQGNGQSLGTLLGKILRIDVNSERPGVKPYVIPGDNPFSGGGGQPEVWAYGLRNPWRFSFDRSTGDLYIADVGQNQWEEIHFLPAGSPGGANFGWSYFEASHPFQAATPAGLNVEQPVAEYDHGQGCSVTGGVVYRGVRLPGWQGIYLYGDYCSGTVWGLFQDAGGWQNQALFRSVGSISSFGEDEQGEVYMVDHNGMVLRLEVR